MKTTLNFWFGCLLLLGVLGSAACQPKSAAATDSTEVADQATTPMPPAAEPEATAGLGEEYALMGNIEIVSYCLPYPKAVFSEDFDRAEYKGQHVLVSNDKTSTITFSGNPMDMTWEELVQKSEADVRAIKGAKLESNNETASTITLVWTEGDHRHFFKKWYRAQANESVTAHVDFPIAEGDRFQPWIDTIAAHSTQCE